MGRRPKQKSDWPSKDAIRLKVDMRGRRTIGSRSMKIHVDSKQKDLSISKDSVRLAVSSLLTYLGISCEEVSIYYVTEKKICQLHDQFFQDPTPTDCISFPIDPEQSQEHLGEIFVCPKTALQYAGKKGLDPYEETTLYTIHGLLHLLGYDDLESSQRRTMRKKEKSCMRHLKDLGLLITKKR